MNHGTYVYWCLWDQCLSVYEANPVGAYAYLGTCFMYAHKHIGIATTSCKSYYSNRLPFSLQYNP